MKLTITRSFLLLALALLAACANQPTTTSSTNKPQSTQQTKVAAFVAASGGKAGYVLAVPSANNFISNKLMLASLKSGSGSDSVDILVALLKSHKFEHLAVMSENDSGDEITAATIEAALKRLGGSKPSTTLYFVGDGHYGASLTALAKANGMDFVAVPYPN